MASTPGAPRAAHVHDAFISYSRKNRDFAAKLKQVLEDYTPPRDLDVPHRHLDVFRDETDFTGVGITSRSKRTCSTRPS